eukprot:jgi/Mesvir1/13322/Mv25527-RA.1
MARKPDPRVATCTLFQGKELHVSSSAGSQSAGNGDRELDGNAFSGKIQDGRRNAGVSGWIVKRRSRGSGGADVQSPTADRRARENAQVDVVCGDRVGRVGELEVHDRGRPGLVAHLHRLVHDLQVPAGVGALEHARHLQVPSHHHVAGAGDRAGARQSPRDGHRAARAGQLQIARRGRHLAAAARGAGQGQVLRHRHGARRRGTDAGVRHRDAGHVHTVGRRPRGGKRERAAAGGDARRLHLHAVHHHRPGAVGRQGQVGVGHVVADARGLHLHVVQEHGAGAVAGHGQVSVGGGGGHGGVGDRDAAQLERGGRGPGRADRKGAAGGGDRVVGELDALHQHRLGGTAREGQVHVGGRREGGRGGDHVGHAHRPGVGREHEAAGRRVDGAAVDGNVVHGQRPVYGGGSHDLEAVGRAGAVPVVGLDDDAVLRLDDEVLHPRGGV